MVKGYKTRRLIELSQLRDLILKSSKNDRAFYVDELIKFVQTE